jgi:hypothetical protein
MRQFNVDNGTPSSSATSGAEYFSFSSATRISSHCMMVQSSFFMTVRLIPLSIPNLLSDFNTLVSIVPLDLLSELSYNKNRLQNRDISMNYKLVHAVQRVAGLRGITKTVFFYLSHYADSSDGSGAFPGIERLADETCFCRRAVVQSLEELERDGWITPESFRRQRVKGWKICIEKLGLTPDQLEIKKKGGIPQPDAPDREAPTHKNHTEQFLEPPDADAIDDWQPGAPMTAAERLKQKAEQRKAELRRRAEQAHGILSL